MLSRPFSFSGAGHVDELLVVRVDAQELAAKFQHLPVRAAHPAVDDRLLHVLHAILEVGKERQVVFHEQLHELEQAVRDGGLLHVALSGDGGKHPRAGVALVEEHEA